MRFSRQAKHEREGLAIKLDREFIRHNHDARDEVAERVGTCPLVGIELTGDFGCPLECGFQSLGRQPEWRQSVRQFQC